MFRAVGRHTEGLASLKFRSILVKSSSALALIGPTDDAATAAAFSLTFRWYLN